MIIFLAVTWDVDPVLLRIVNFEVMWYGLCWAIAIGLGGFYFSHFIKREKLNPDLNNIFWWGALVTIVGARLGHCLFYDPVYYFTHMEIFTHFIKGFFTLLKSKQRADNMKPLPSSLTNNWGLPL